MTESSGTVVILKCGDDFRIKVVQDVEKFWMDKSGVSVGALDRQYLIKKEFSEGFVESKDYYTSLTVAEMLLNSSDADRVVDIIFEGLFENDN